MHISEGVLAAPVLISGVVLTAGGVAVGLKKMENRKVPTVALLSSTFFVASLIQVPLGPASVHLTLNGLTGLLLGWMAFPAVLAYYLSRPLLRSSSRPLIFAASAICGALAILLSGLLIGLSLVWTGKPFWEIAQLTVVAHLPVMVVEGMLTGLCVLFLQKVKPELLGRGSPGLR